MIPLAFTEDEAAARHWLATLEAAAIPAELRIEDARRMGTSSSILPLGPVYATALYVAAERRTEAAAVLIDLGWDGRHVSGGLDRKTLPTAALLGGALAATVAALAVAVAALLQGG
jgi:hypothetical protein